ncbi:MAG: hypothetical protein WC480_01740 [Patescibacteria group bacterium]
MKIIMILIAVVVGLVVGLTSGNWIAGLLVGAIFFGLWAFMTHKGWCPLCRYVAAKEKKR